MQRRIAFLVLIVLSAVFAGAAWAQGSAPVIVVSPTNRVSFLGGSATMSVTATGEPPLTYRWMKDGVSLPKGTNRFLSMIFLVSSNAGNYAAIVSNPYGSVTSQVASLTLTGAPPNIYLHPVDTLLCAGVAGGTLVVQAGGSPPFNYQWSRNGVVLPDSNTNRLLMPGIAANLGEYFAVVSNPYGSQTSTVARLRVGPRILQQPTNTTVEAGTELLFTVMAETCSEPRYQWRYNGVDITGYSTNQTLYYSYPTKEYEGDFTVVVSDTSGSVTSEVARLRVLEFPPLITEQPEDLINWINWQNPYVRFQVSFRGAPKPAFQWRFNGVNLPGQTNRFIQLPVLPEHQGGYSVVLSNSVGSVTSREAVFAMKATPPMIEPWGQPVSETVCPYTTNPPVLRVQLTHQGLAVNSFQWRKDGVDLPGKTSSVLLLSLLPESFGDYAVVVTNYFGAVTSVVATVSAGPIILQQPQKLIEVEAGGIADLTSEVRSCNPFQLQWQRNGVDVPGATIARVSFHPLSIGDSGDYTLIIRHASGSLTSTVSRLEVIQRSPRNGPGSPEDLETRAGDVAGFYPGNYDPGAPAGLFQWHFNGTPIPGATNDHLEFLADSPSQQGRYSLVISNEVGSVTSRWARLTLLFSLPYFESEPEDIEVLAGEYAGFYATALGAPAPSYQWLFNGLPIRHETNEYLSFIAHGTNQVGGYSVVASNLLGAVTSRVATITLQYSPPEFGASSADQLVGAGAEVVIFAIASGAPPPSYQWFLNGNILPGESNDFLSFIAGFTNQMGDYWAVANNEYGSATSHVMRLDIDIPPPTFSFHPPSMSLLEGEHFFLSFALDYNMPAFVQWQKDGIDVPGATNNPFALRSVTTNDIGGYSAIVWNDVGRATSSVAWLEVRVVGPLDHWTWRHPLPQGNDLDAVAYGNGRRVALGYGGGVVVSTDGTNWADAHQPGQVRSRESLAFGNGVFVTLDIHGPQTSTNGVDWVDQDYWGVNYFTPLAFGNGRFVAANVNDTDVATSTNGVDWKIHEDVLTLEIYGLTYGGGLFVAARTSQDYPDLEAIHTSVDGVVWTERFALVGSSFTSMAYGAGKFVVAPSYLSWHVVTSTNGIDWIEEPLPQPSEFQALSIAWGKGVWVVGGYGATIDGVRTGLEYSTDAIHWTPVPGVGTNSVHKVMFDGTRFIAVGSYGFVATSANGIDWTMPQPGSDLNLRGITYANGMFITVGNGGLIYTSADGRAWTRRDSGTVGNLRSVTWFHDRFIIVGGDDSWPDNAIILSSADGIQWQPHPGYGSLYGVAHDGERLVAVGNGGVIATSLDGVVWTNLPFVASPGAGTPTMRDLNAVTWTGEEFVAVGKNGTIITSTNGLEWSSTGPNNGKSLKGVAYGNGVYVTVGNDGRYFTSEDGTSWSRRDLLSARDFEEISFGGGRFIAVGADGQMYTSEDGTNWIRRVTVCDHNLRGVIYVEGSYYVAGNNQTIMQSGQAEAALRITRLSPSGDVQVEVLGEAGRAYRLQGSPDLTQWTDLHSFTAGAGAVRYTDNSPGASLRRFYRVISP